MTYQEFWHRLTPLYAAGEAQAIARMALDMRFGLSLTDVLCGKVNDLSAEDTRLLEEIVRRLETGEPVQYVLGEAPFCGRNFHVEPGVLIPRPETEMLLPLICKAAKASPSSPVTILDIGTGSGCIAITASLKLPEAQVTAWDISDKALHIAQNNAERLGARVTFEKQNALTAAEDYTDNTFPGSRQYDIIVSNPPYIAERERKNMAPNVLDHEPTVALFVPDATPLLFYKAISHYAVKALKPSGCLLFEINPLFAEELKEMLQEAGFNDVELMTDLFGKQRMVQARRKK